MRPASRLRALGERAKQALIDSNERQLERIMAAETAGAIAAAILEGAPKPPHESCTSWPHCSPCAAYAQAAKDAELAGKFARLVTP